MGYRHIDTAQMYGNEAGSAPPSRPPGIPRDELWITTKLNNGFHRPDDARRAFAESLDRLGLDQVDLFLIHWPLPTRYDGDFVIDLAHADRAPRRRPGPVDRASPTSSPTHLAADHRRDRRRPGRQPDRGAPVLRQRGGPRRRRARTASPPRPGRRSPRAGERRPDDRARSPSGVGRTPAQVDPALAPPARRHRVPEVDAPASGCEENFAIFDFELSDDDVATISGARPRARTAAPGRTRTPWTGSAEPDGVSPACRRGGRPQRTTERSPRRPPAGAASAQADDPDPRKRWPQRRSSAASWARSRSVSPDDEALLVGDVPAHQPVDQRQPRPR